MTEPTTEAPPAENPATKDAPGKAQAKIGVMIATPLRHFRDVKDLPKQIGRTLRELSQREDARGYEFEFAAACGGLCSARNRIVHDFLKSENKWLLQWDADLHDQHHREADAILRMLSWKQPIVGGLYCKRDPFAKRPKWVANWINGAKIQLGGLLQVAELGGGFKLTHRKVYEEIRRIFGEIPMGDVEHQAQSIMYRERETGEMIAGFHQIRVVDNDQLSEDFWFDYLCRCVKIPIVADTVVRLRQIEPAIKRDDGEVVPERVYPEGDWPPIPAEDAV